MLAGLRMARPLQSLSSNAAANAASEPEERDMNAWTTIKKIVTVGIAAVALAGCAGEPVLGEWESTERVGEKRHTLDLSEEGEGTAAIRFYIDVEGYSVLTIAEMDLRWEDRDDGRYRIDLECDEVRFPEFGESTSDCSEVDFEMECELFGDDEDSLECDGDGLFESFDFEWRRP